jgi:hypothetical protein
MGPSPRNKHIHSFISCLAHNGTKEHNNLPYQHPLSATLALGNAIAG